MTGPRRAAAGPLAAFSLCALIWSSTFLFISIGNDTVPPVWAASLRLVAAGLLLALIALAGRLPWPRGAELRAAVLFGIVDFGISLPLLYWGERIVPSSVAAILFATIPLCTALLAAAFGLERLRALTLLAALTGLAGVALLFSGEIGSRLPAGALAAVFVASVTAALAGVLLKLSPGGHPVSVNAVAHLAGAPLCLAGSFLLREPHALPASAGGWLSIGYLTIVGSIVAFATFMWLVQRWDVTSTSFIAVITPVLATVLGATVRHERPGAMALVGGAVVIAGVALAIVSDRRAA